MAYTPISGSAVQYMQNSVAANDHYIKFYASGTTTPISMATDSAGGTLLAKAQFNAQGYAINGSGDEFIPHMNQTYKVVFYPNATDADNNTFANAVYNIDLIDPYATLAGAAFAKNFATLALAVADVNLVDGDALSIGERETGKGGGAIWDVVLSSTVTENTYDIVQCTGVPTLSLVIRKSNTMDANMLGAFQSDTAAVCTPALQAYAAYCDANGVSFRVSSSVNETDDYNLDEVIEFTTNVSVFGIGAYMPRFITEDTGLFKWPDGAINVDVTRIRAGMAVRHTTTPNTHVAVEFPGNTGSRPFYNNVYNCFFDGFGVTINTEWAWEQRFRDNIMINCGKMVKARGASVNNHMTGNEGTGNGIAFDIGDSTSQIEGWWIRENLLDAFDQCVNMVGSAYNRIIDNIFDHISGNSGVVIQSGTATPAFGNYVKDNYIAFSNAANEGIRLLNNVSSSSNTGSLVDNNEIFAYATFSVVRGILIDGTNEIDNIISRNKTNATTYDIDIASTALTTTISDNYMRGAGFRTAANVFYHNNHGTMISSQTLVRTIVGDNTDYWNTGQPATGSYVQGDKVWRTAPALDGNNMTLLGWVRLTTGSGHVAGTDWAAMRVSHVSPAT